MFYTVINHILLIKSIFAPDGNVKMIYFYLVYFLDFKKCTEIMIIISYNWIFLQNVQLVEIEKAN